MSKLKKEVEAELARRRAVGPSSAEGGAGALSREESLVSGRISGCQLPPAKKKNWISIRKFAASQGVSKTAIEKAIADGRLKTYVVSDKRWPVLDFDEASAAYKKCRVLQNNNGFNGPDEDGDDENPDGKQEEGWYSYYNRERALLEEVKRKRAEAELAVMQGKLHYAEDVEVIIGDMVSAFRSKILSMPTKLAGRLLGQTDVASIEAELRRELNEALEELSHYDPEKVKQRSMRRGTKILTAEEGHSG